MAGAPGTAQQSKSPGMVAIARVADGKVLLRWAPGATALWKAGNTAGYKIERVTLGGSNATLPDSIKFKQAFTVAPSLTPWKQDDTRWQKLLGKNKSAAFLYGSLYPAKKSTGAEKNEMAFALLMKMCDLDKELAAAAGLSLTDSTVRKSDTYLYRVTLAQGAKARYGQAFVQVNAGEITAPAPIASLKAKFGDRRAVLTFETLGNTDYAGYWIERSEDSVSFLPVNQVPFIRATTKYDGSKKESGYGDSLPANNKKYFYRVRGITCFGEPGPASNVVSGMGKPAFMEFPIIDSAVLIKNAAVKLQFHIKPAKGITIRHFFVTRSEKRTGAYSIISGTLSPQQNIFTDTRPGESNFYKICAVNAFYDTSFSLAAYIKILDETPPQVPGQPTGLIDSNGIVKISWTPNTDPDLLGYRVYRCNSPKEQPFELTHHILKQPAFTDTVSLKTLTQEVYYAVRAVDQVYNNSDYSSLCKLKRPDKVAPVAVVFSKIAPTDSTIELAWHNSSSSDVRGYALYRQEDNGNWTLLKEWKAGENLTVHADANVLPEKSYQYRLDAVDESGNRASAQTQSVLFKPSFYPRIRPFTATIDRTRRQIELQWISDNSLVYNFTIYKAKAGDPLQAFKTIDAKSTYFIDRELYPNNQYRYAIKATLKNGSETKLSEVIIAEY